MSQPEDPWHSQAPISPQPLTQPGAPSKKGLSSGAIVGIVLGAVGLLLCAGGIFTVVLFWPDDDKAADRGTATQTTGAGTSKGASPKTGRVIRFEATAESGKALLVNWSTVEDSALLRDVEMPADRPWVLDVTLESRTGLVGVNVTGTGKVACKLYVDGQMVDDGESEGVVNCSKLVSG